MTLKLHPEFLEKNGKKEFVVLTYEEFVALQEVLEDAQDLLTLRAAKAAKGDGPTLSLDELKAELGH